VADTFGSIYTARNTRVIRQNAVVLPLYQLILLFVFLVGFAAILQVPDLRGPEVDLALFKLSVKTFDPWLVGVIGAAGVLTALVPGSMILMAAAILLANNIYRVIHRGAALLYGDGVITPAISVLSAIEGLKFSPNAASFVVPATLVILVGLFALQYRGTGSVGRLFGPVMVVWFVVIGILGIVNIWAVPAILEAFNPREAVRFAIASPTTLFIVLGGVFLALTGGEALYAGRPAIRLAWFGLVLPALILCYFGQGALVLVNPKAIENPFYTLAPVWAVVPLVVLAALATIIVSQALISGVFSMTRQAIQMGLSPRCKVVPTSSDEAGQVYLPTANWLLMVGTLLVVIMFRTSDALASAYGIAVSGTMLVTTILLYRVAVHRWNWPPIVAGAVIGFFSAIEAIFLVSNSLKIVQGGWFPLLVGGAIATLMLCWRGFAGGEAAPVRHVDSAARSLPHLCRRSRHRPRAGSWRLADQGRARRLADVDPPRPA
jgi:K+ transporter